MRRRWRTAAYVLGIAGGAFIALAAILIGLANTDFGRRTVASVVETLSGGRVSILGLQGRIPDRLRLAHVEVRDATGVWLRADDIVLDWSPWTLLWNRVEIARAAAGRIEVLRFPVSEEGGSQYKVDVARLQVTRIETSAAVSGRPAILTAQGSLRYVSWRDWSADMTVTRQDEQGTYHARASFTNDFVAGMASISERSGGLITGLLGLNDIGPIEAEADARPANNANAITFRLQAGAMSASGGGSVDISRQTADLDFMARAPSMELRSDISWQSLSAEGHLYGSFARPDIAADITIRGLDAKGNKVDVLTGNVQGAGGMVRFDATASGLILASDGTGLFARAPIRIAGDVDLSMPARPFRFTFSHPLLTAQGNGRASEPLSGHLTLNAPNLQSLGAAGGVDIGGRAALDLDIAETAASYRIVAAGSIEAKGQSLFSRIVGPRARFNANTTVAGSDISIAGAQFDGAKANAKVSGTMRNGVLNIKSTLTLNDVSEFLPKIMGAAAVELAASGPVATAAFSATGTADLATAGFQRQRVSFSAHASGFPRPESGDFRLDGAFNDAPVSAAGAFRTNSNNTIQVALNRAAWKSLSASADITMRDAAPVNGSVRVDVANLRDLTVFTGLAMQGSLQATVGLVPRSGLNQAAVSAIARNIAVEDYKADAVSISGTVGEPLDAPTLSLNIDASGLNVAGLTGRVSAQLAGPLDGVAIRLTSALSGTDGFPIALTASGTFNRKPNSLILTSLDAKYRDQTTALIQPARFDAAQGLAVDRILLSVGGGRASFAGRISPVLAAEGSVQNISLANFRAFLPEWQPEGILSGALTVSGTLDAPRGSATLHARGLRTSAIAAGIPPASLDASAEFLGEVATVHANVAAGPSAQTSLSGDVSLKPGHALDLQVAGRVDLALFNPILSAEGRKIAGQLGLDGAIGGTMSQPQISGRANLADGEVQDIPYGFRVHDIVATAESDGRTLRLTRFAGVAGDGTISANGTLAFTQGTPVNVMVSSRNARPLVSDRFAASFDSDLKLTGLISDGPSLAGTINLTRGEINLPDRFPPSIAVLDVRRPGQAEAAHPRRFAPIKLDLRVSSPGRVFVRGRGVDAEVQGQMRVMGTTAAPQFQGGFDLRRGTLSVVGQTLDFTKGNVSFNGASIQNKIDPTLDFAATDNSGGVAVTIALTGNASAPKIQLSSSPNLPQDEILAHILFQQSTTQLSPLQLAQVAQAAVALTDAGGGFDPVGLLRESLGLDRLAVGSSTAAGSTDTRATVTAGKYIARNVYVGATQGVGGGNQAEVQIDLSQNLKVIGSVNNGIADGPSARVKQNDTSTSFGLRYQFEY
jgi:translocation and assembly module TamB